MKIKFKDHGIVSIIGLIFIAIGLIFNEWSIATFFSTDGVITNFPKRVIIWSFDFLSILTGFLIFKYRNFIRSKGREIIFTAIVFVVFILFVEGGMRGFNYVKNKIDSPDMSSKNYLGWESQENISWKKKKPGYGEILFTTSKYGFRVFGDINTNKIKIFVLGDSYTQGTTVSDGNAYYDYLKKHHNNIEIFAYGAGGYGSLQEYMILDKYLEMIKPDLILWQFCSNDFVNNSYELESRSFFANSHNTRPYFNYKNGQITWSYPRQSFGWIYKIVHHSYLLNFLYIKFNIIEVETVGSIEDNLTEDHPLAKEAIETTSAIMGLAIKRAGKIPIVAFPVDNDKRYLPWSSNAFSNICKKYSIHYIDYLPKVLEEAKASGIVVDAPENGHWNSTGHSIAGKTILDYLIEHDLL